MPVIMYSKWKRLCFLVIPLWSGVSPFDTVQAASVSSDENIIFFPTDGYMIGDNHWLLPIHGWVFEVESNSVWRNASIDLLLNSLELAPSATASRIFESRARSFLVDNERNKKVCLNIGDYKTRSKPSHANGHFLTSATIPENQLPSLIGDHWLKFQSQPRKGDGRTFDGYIQLLNPNGVSIISDIDDTIKESNVSDKKELLKNTFLRKFKPIRGLANVYQKWQSTGAAFHYVSASPWQLYPSLLEFISTENFPKGSFYLRNFRIKDGSFFQLFKSSQQYKFDTIEKIIVNNPKRMFILVGDSGEHDPEVYGHLARKYSEQIIKVLIRQAPGQTINDIRFETAFGRISKSKWLVFAQAEELLTLELAPK